MPRKKTKTAPAKTPAKRGPKFSADKIPQTFTFRLDGDLRPRLEQAAEEAGMSASSFMNQVLRERIGNLSFRERIASLEARLSIIESRPGSMVMRLVDGTTIAEFEGVLGAPAGAEPPASDVDGDPAPDEDADALEAAALEAAALEAEYAEEELDGASGEELLESAPAEEDAQPQAQHTNQGKGKNSATAAA